MSGAGFLSSVRIIAAKDLAIEWKTREGISAMALFSLIVLVVFNFAFEVVTNCLQLYVRCRGCHTKPIKRTPHFRS